jgi:hypothetical protein
MTSSEDGSILADMVIDRDYSYTIKWYVKFPTLMITADMKQDHSCCEEKH